MSLHGFNMAGVDMGAPPAGAAPAPSIRDMTVYNAMAAVLRALGRFRTVDVGGQFDIGRVGSKAPYATFRPMTEANAPAESRERDLHVVTYKLGIVVRMNDPGQRTNALDLLKSVCWNVIVGKDYGGLVIPDYSKLAAGGYAPEKHPEQGFEFDGQFAYMIGHGGMAQV